MRYLKLMFIVTLIISSIGLYAQSNKKPTAVLFSAHPGDWEYGCGATAYMLKEAFDFHIIMAGKGEMGFGDEPSEEGKKLRVAELEKAANIIDAKVYHLDLPDGNIYSSKETIDKVSEILTELKPQIIFTMWGIEVRDHAATHHISLIALQNTKLIHSSEVYFYETAHGDQTNQFDPDLYVNYSRVFDKKIEIVRCHETQNPDDLLVNEVIEISKFYGKVARCDYAEAFKVYYPLTNTRWGRKNKYTLLEIE